MSALTEQLKWRYAVKKMNGTKVLQEKINNILEAIRLAPSSRGLQPYQIFVIEDTAVRERIFNESCPQPQIKESSLILVFAGYKKITEEHVSTYLRKMENTRGEINPDLKQYLQNSFNDYIQAGEEKNFAWTTRQAYLAFGIAIVAAALENVDATPMDGFNPATLDNVLGLDKQNLGSTAILALGYRDEANDWLVRLPKVRKSKEELFTGI